MTYAYGWTDAREDDFIICSMLCYSYGTGNCRSWVACQFTGTAFVKIQKQWKVVLSTTNVAEQRTQALLICCCVKLADCRWVSYYSTVTMVLTKWWMAAESSHKWRSDSQLQGARLALLEPSRKLALSLSMLSAKLPGVSGRPRSNTVPFLLIIRLPRRQKRM